MSSARIKMLHKNNFKVCRFCLHSNFTELDSIYDKVVGDSIAMNPMIKNALTMLQIQIPSDDALSKLVCISCRDTLISIHHFRRNAQRSLDLLEKAMETKPKDLFIANTSIEKAITNREVPLDESYSVEELAPDSKGDDDQVANIQDMNEETEVPDAEATIPTMEDVQDQIKVEEEYLEEDFLLEDDGYIPVEADGEMITYMSKPKSPKPRKPAAAKICTVCGAKTTAMSVHMRTHTNDRPFGCDMCDLRFYTNGKLRCHYDSVHVGERKFSCEVCGKSFVLKKNLKAHMMSHSDKREHVCSHCSKSFLFKWSLTAHERIHTGERPYECTWQGCGKRFVTVSNLIQHQKTTNHWKEAPEVICPLCGKAFQTQASLKAHQTKTHGSEVYQ